MPVYYAEANFDRLKIEMAQGNGEYLNGFALVMGCNETTAPQFKNYLQTNYETLIPNTKVTANDFIEKITSKIQNCIQVI